MAISTYNLMPRATIGVIAINAIALIAFACAPVAQEHPLLVVGILAFLFVQAFLPACRLCDRSPLSPINIAQGFYWVQLVLVAVLIGYFGFSQGTLPYLPSKEAINAAIVVHVVGYLSFCIAYQCFSKPMAEVRAETEPSNAAGTAYLIIPFAVLGLLGLFLTYGSIGAFIEHVSSPIHHRLRADEPTTPAGAAGSFLKHFIGFAVVLAWSWWIATAPRGKALSVAVTAGVVLALLAANFSYNRGTMLGPLVGLAAAFSAHVWRIPFKGVVLAGVLALSTAFAFGWYRSTDLDITELSTSSIEDTWQPDGVVDFVQIYASAPQLSGYMIEQLDYEGKFYHGGTLLPSLVYPIPVLGKPYRDRSGTVIFNELIYGDSDNLDQIIPLSGELYINFHLFGVVIGNVILGWLLCCFQRKFMAAPNPIESYAWLTLAFWTVFPGSLPVISQLFVYSFWPVYVYMAVKSVWFWSPRTSNACVLEERRIA